MRISLIRPLFDRRTAGWRPLETALAQSLPREQYEIVVVIGNDLGNEPAVDAHADALLHRCDAVVRIAADPSLPENEIPFLMAGCARATGDLLFFMEGHTELATDCCATIAAHFRDNPQSRIAWAPRIHRSTLPLGLLIGMHGKRQEQRARTWRPLARRQKRHHARVLRTSVRLDARYMRVGERVLCERVLRESAAGAASGRPEQAACCA